MKFVFNFEILHMWHICDIDEKMWETYW